MCLVSEAVEVLRSGFHGVDDQFAAVVEGEHDQFEEARGGVGSDDQPAAGVVLVVEGPCGECVFCGVQHRLIVEAVAAVVLAGGVVKVRQRGPIRARRRGLLRSVW